MNNIGSDFTSFQGDIFVAVPVPAEVQSDIAKLQDSVKEIIGDTFLPQKLSNLHITVQLIGKTTCSETLNKIDSLLKSILLQDNTSFSLGSALGTGHIMIKGIYVKLMLTSDHLSALAQKVRSILELNGVQIAERFDFPDNGHISIGTITPDKIDNLEEVISLANTRLTKLKKDLSSFTSDQFPVTTLSILKSNNPAPLEERVYSSIKTYNL